MLYQKPKNIKYTQMAIYIDSFLQQECVTEEEQCKIFEYLYHLIVMLARKGQYFRKAEYYDDFAITVASDVYFRLFSPKRFQLKDDGTPRLAPVKSCLNYLKSILNFRRIDFEQKNYAQVMSYVDEDEAVETAEYTFSDYLVDSVKDINAVEFECCIQEINIGIKKFLERLPYPQHSSDQNNIYLSCLLTFLNSVTIPNSDISRLHKTHTPEYLDNLCDKLVITEANKPIALLYHLDECMHDYIVVLVREIKHYLAKEMSYELNYDVSSKDMQYIAIQDINSNMIGGDDYLS